MSEDLQRSPTDPAPALDAPGNSLGLSTCVMQAGGHELFDFSVVRVPTLDGGELRIDAREFDCQIVESGGGELSSLSKDGARLLGRMLLAYADGRSA
jgi:hypothetical protein